MLQEKITNEEKSALMEMANIGASSAARQITRLMKIKVNLTSPQFNMYRIDKAEKEILKSGQKRLLMSLEVLNDFGGVRFAIFNEKDLIGLIRKFLKKEIKSLQQISGIELLNLKRIGKIVLCYSNEGFYKFLGQEVKCSNTDISLENLSRKIRSLLRLVAKNEEKIIKITIDMNIPETKTDFKLCYLFAVQDGKALVKKYKKAIKNN